MVLVTIAQLCGVTLGACKRRNSRELSPKRNASPANRCVKGDAKRNLFPSNIGIDLSDSQMKIIHDLIQTFLE